VKGLLKHDPNMGLIYLSVLGAEDIMWKTPGFIPMKMNQTSSLPMGSALRVVQQFSKEGLLPQIHLVYPLIKM